MLIWEDFQECWQSAQCINLFETLSKTKTTKLKIKYKYTKIKQWQ